MFWTTYDSCPILENELKLGKYNYSKNMTLTELIPIIEQLSVPDKLKLFHLLAEQLETKQDISPLESNKVYYMPTPYDVFGSGEVLMEAMKLNHDENI